MCQAVPGAAGKRGCPQVLPSPRACCCRAHREPAVLEASFLPPSKSREGGKAFSSLETGRGGCSPARAALAQSYTLGAAETADSLQTSASNVAGALRNWHRSGAIPPPSTTIHVLVSLQRGHKVQASPRSAVLWWGTQTMLRELSSSLVWQSHW